MRTVLKYYAYKPMGFREATQSMRVLEGLGYTPGSPGFNTDSVNRYGGSVMIPARGRRLTSVTGLPRRPLPQLGDWDSAHPRNIRTLVNPVTDFYVTGDYGGNDLGASAMPPRHRYGLGAANFNIVGRNRRWGGSEFIPGLGNWTAKLPRNVRTALTPADDHFTSSDYGGNDLGAVPSYISRRAPRWINRQVTFNKQTARQYGMTPWRYDGMGAMPTSSQNKAYPRYTLGLLTAGNDTLGAVPIWFRGARPSRRAFYRKGLQGLGQDMPSISPADMINAKGEDPQAHYYLSDLIAKVKDFGTLYRQFLDDFAWAQSNAPDLVPEGNQINATAASAKAKVDEINRTVDSSSNWMFDAGVSGLGILPLIVGAAVLIAAIALVTDASTKMYAYHQKVLLVQQGKASASSLDTGISGKSVLGDISSAAMWLAIGAGVLMLGPALLRRA